ncbi:universal stress protein [Streptomyces sp. NBC_01750]|uniref:universal stress protein n=1 Tax=Streptomyces sp. NBC_01750 TaxID=2975928 RepID=UPI002DDC6AFE|nr:universal stress protein [Streptomyces sp. NBC_01750]WSD31338.1 universal stress protein [Streptomyces sp. NBC_01750]
MHDAPLTRVTGSSDSVPTEASGPYRDVVLGVDIREDCDAVIAFAFDAAARRAAGLRVVHGWTTPLVYTQYAAVDAGQAVAQALSDLLMPWRQKFPSVNVVEQALFGGASQQLVHASQDAELVVVGRRSTTGRAQVISDRSPTRSCITRPRPSLSSRTGEQQGGTRVRGRPVDQ